MKTFVPDNDAKILTLLSFPRLRKETKEVTTYQNFDLEICPTKLERSLYKIDQNMVGIIRVLG